MPSEVNLTQSDLIAWATVAAQFAVIVLLIGLISAFVVKSNRWLFLLTATASIATAFVLFSRMAATEIDSDFLVAIVVPVVIASCWARDWLRSRE